jgi:hypothetical protein
MSVSRQDTVHIDAQVSDILTILLDSGLSRVEPGVQRGLRRKAGHGQAALSDPGQGVSAR